MREASCRCRVFPKMVESGKLTETEAKQRTFALGIALRIVEQWLEADTARRAIEANSDFGERRERQ